MCTALERNGMGGCAAIGVEVFMACSGSNSLLRMLDGLNFKEFVAFLSAFSPLPLSTTKLIIFKVYDSDCNGKVTFHDMLRALRDLSGPFMSDQQREEVLTQVLEEAGYAKDCSLVLSDFMKVLKLA
ncbi:Calcineurin subunit B [Glycine max]|nr:Calcineurin subunit B [Glycine max]